MILDSWTLAVGRVDSRPMMGQWGKRSLHFRAAIVAPSGARWDGFYSVGSAVPLESARVALEGSAEVYREWRYGSAKRIGGAPLLSRWRVRFAIGHPSTVSGAATVDAIRSCYRPSLLDILECVTVDASTVDACPTFRSYVADALDSYNSCTDALAFLLDAGVTDGERWTLIQGR